jgi:hypothetical protein
VLLEKIQLRLVAEKAGFVDRQILHQLGQFRFALLADQQPVVGVEGIGAALLQPAQQPVLQEVGAALVEVHAALLIDQRLQQPKFRFRQDGSWCRSECAHAFSRSPRTSLTSPPWASRLLLLGRPLFASGVSFAWACLSTLRLAATAGRRQQLAHVQQYNQPSS